MYYVLRGAIGSSVAFITGCMLAVSASAQNASNRVKTPIWSLTTQQCKVWNLYPEPNEMVEWNGECVDGYASGSGRLTWYKNGQVNEVHEGSMTNGHLNGKVRSTYYKYGKIAGVYNGDVLNDYHHGYGIYRFSDGSEYSGEFKFHKFDGHGILRYADGHVYDGQWLNGRRHGYGEIKYPSGNIYKGQFSDNKIVGTGYYFDSSGRILRKVQAGSVNLINENGVYKIPVTINGAIKLNFVLDSGAADVAIPADVLLVMLRSGTLSSSDFIDSQVYVQADGTQIPSKRFVIRKLRVGDFEVSDVIGMVSNLNGDLLLGQSFLQKFKKWTLSNDDHTVYLEQ